MAWTINNSFDRTAKAVNPPSYPNEMLVKILSSSNYSKIVNELPPFAKTLEVGVFSGNNARFFIENGFDLTGSEINLEMVELCKINLERLNYPVPKVTVGSNTNLDSPDSIFDLLVSINTIHYSVGSEISLALKEFSRVLKPTAWAIIETPGQNHFAVTSAIRNSEFDYTWEAGGFRQKEHFGFFDSRDHFKKNLLGFFSEVEVCKRLEEYPNVTLEFWTAICKK